MGAPTKYLHFTGETWDGAGYTPDGTIPAGAIACTDAQAAASGPWTMLVSGSIVIGTPPSASLALQATEAMAAGLTITLSGSVTLAATVFPVDPATTVKIGAVVTTILARGAFPGGGTTYPLKDASGAWHTFTIAQYEAVAGAIAAYVAALDLIIDGNPNGATSLPSASVSLTV